MRAFGPGESRVTAAARRRNRGEHAPGLRIDLLDAVLGDLKQMLSVESRPGMRGETDRSLHGGARSGVPAQAR
jgi:hypothetical protein